MQKIIILFTVAFIFFIRSQNLMGQVKAEMKVTDSGKQSAALYTYKLVPSIHNTWGYDIFRDNKLMIHQMSIPGLPGNEGFKTKTEAGKIALLVIEKLQKGEMPPRVTLEEMRNLKVL